MAFDATPAAQRRRLSRLPGPTPRSSAVRVNSPLAPSTPAATPPQATASRRARQSLLVYPPAESTPSSPSLSAPPPFDWEAARGNGAPPYATPGKASKIKVAGASPGKGGSSLKKRIFRKPSLYERVQSIPSRIAFEISMFPHNIPLPPPKTTGQLLGGLMHLTHMTVKWFGRSHAIAKEDPDDAWKSEVDWTIGDDGVKPGWSWTTPITIMLLVLSLLNALYMFTRIRTYQLQLRNELVKSAHASIVTKQSAEATSPPQPLILRALVLLLQSIRTAWRLAFGTSPSPEDLIAVDLQPGANKIQQLEVWNPGELETHILIVYSPAHFLVWRIFSAANWFSSFILLGILSLQIHTLIFAYESLIKDKAILSAEVMHEYDAKFVNPRLHGIKKDAGTMTNEAEMVDNWRNFGYHE